MDEDEWDAEKGGGAGTYFDFDFKEGGGRGLRRRRGSRDIYIVVVNVLLSSSTRICHSQQQSESKGQHNK